MLCTGQLRLVLATRYLVILARGYEDRITTSSRITRHPVALEADWYNKIARYGWSIKNASTLPFTIICALPARLA